MAPGMWASSNCSLVRASTRIEPPAIADSTPRGVSGVGAPSSSISGPRLRATMDSTFGGRSPTEPRSPRRKTRGSSGEGQDCGGARGRLSRTSRWRSRGCRTSTRPGVPARPRPRLRGRGGARALSGRCPRRPSRGSMARSGRATSPMNNESPVSTAQGSPPRPASRSRNEVCSGRWPGVWTASIVSAPS